MLAHVRPKTLLRNFRSLKQMFKHGVNLRNISKCLGWPSWTVAHCAHTRASCYILESNGNTALPSWEVCLFRQTCGRKQNIAGDVRLFWKVCVPRNHMSCRRTRKQVKEYDRPLRLGTTSGLHSVVVTFLV